MGDCGSQYDYMVYKALIIAATLHFTVSSVVDLRTSVRVTLISR